MNLRYRITAMVTLLLMAVAAIQAQDVDRQRWISEIRTYKHEFLTRELDLSREQQNQFFPLYDEMEDEIERLNAETRDAEARVTKDADATDLEVENTARTIFELKRAEGQIELTYFDKFREILQPRQLLGLKEAERKFTRELMRSHYRLRSRTK